MKKLKLYKFRGISEKSRCISESSDFERVKNILETGKFHLAHWKEFNDPMEGFFSYLRNTNTDNETINHLISYKNQLRICSFSKKNDDIRLWSHYSDCHKGISIEIEVDLDCYKNKLFKIIYLKNIPDFKIDRNTEIIHVLKNKVKLWEFEKEYRYISECESAAIGNITGVYFGVRCGNSSKNKIQDILTNKIPTYNTRIDFDVNKIKVLDKLNKTNL